MNLYSIMEITFVLLLGFTLVMVANAQVDQSGFISIDCGLPQGTNYVDRNSGITYTSDAGFVESGISRNISSIYQSNTLEQQFMNVRSFPEGTRNCYTMRLAQGKGKKYLIRARFLYANYDGENQTPEFDLHLGVETWDTVNLGNESSIIAMEVIHIPSSNYVYVCLVNTGLGTPFISTLELRLLNETMYTTKSGSLLLYTRVDFASLSNQLVRYKDDLYDRIWWPFDWDNYTTLSTLRTVNSPSGNMFKPPSIVMSTASTPKYANEPLTFYWESVNSTDEFYIYMHFAEVEALNDTQFREFNIYLNGNLWYGLPFVPSYLLAETIYTKNPSSGYSKYEISINRTINSTLPPIINAFEAYTMKNFVQLETDEEDVGAILSIKLLYNLTRNWQGDPCAPQAFVWRGLNCSYGVQTPRIISLNLSWSELEGTIAPNISNLTMLRILDLSNNNLTGQVPDFLSQLASLNVLNLKGNNFTGSIPAKLLEKSRNGMLSLSVDGQRNNSNTCQPVSCEKKKRSNVVIPIVASILAASFVVLTVLVTFWLVKRRKREVKKVDDVSEHNGGSLETRNRQFTYSEVLTMTNNFQRVIGKGGFGRVYHGYVGDNQVAVKMLSPSSTQGFKEFHAEANILMNVHHKNLTSFVGYCNEGTNMGLVYEYMLNGSLEKHLSDRNSYVTSWEERVRIAIDAAQGLEYLHSSCNPPIIHRDVKCTNILLDENFQAKLADFGLSRIFPVEGGTHLTTIVAGTPGYLDPDYYTSYRLTEKSDVYSFGVVLLNIITGEPAIGKNEKMKHISQWVNSMLEQGDVKIIVDPRLKGGFSVNSAWKAVEIAMACVSRSSSRRPTMNYVVKELKECLEMERAYNDTEQTDSIGVISMSLEGGLGPMAR